MMMAMMMMMIASAYPFFESDGFWSTGEPMRNTKPDPSLSPFVQFETGARVVLEGDLVSMSCLYLPSNETKYVWRYLNRSSGVVKEIGHKWMLLRIAMLGDSGQYNCTATKFDRVVAQFELTVVERLLSPSVVASSQGSIVLEGSGVVTLNCVPTSGPSPITWSWYKMGGAGLQQVGAEQTLTLRRMEDSGEYQCQAYTYTLNLTQEESSLRHQVIIIPSAVGLPVGVAALVLVLLLCLFLLLLLGVGLFLHRENKALDKLSHGPPPRVELSHGPPTKGLPGPGMEFKDNSGPTEGEVYMNYETSGEAYADLNCDDEDNTYDRLG